MKILIVEDEIKTGDYLRQGLIESGFVVDLARTGLDGHHLALTDSYDLIVLDVNLPDVDGWRIVQALRNAMATGDAEAARAVAAAYVEGYGALSQQSGPGFEAEATTAG